MVEEVGPSECQLARYSAAFYVLRLCNMNIVTLCGTMYENPERDHFLDTAQDERLMLYKEIIAVCIRHHVNTFC